jgi:glycosyltransferase involved in cell wall biosynthesis
MDNPFISVILSTYNRAWCIERAINSVLCQSYKNFELIIVNDGSTDDTQTLLQKKHYLDNNLIKYVHLEKNKGMGYARNIGFDNASGDLLLNLDSDDEFVANAFQVISDDYYLLEDSSLGGLIYRRVDHRGVFTGNFPAGVSRLSYIDFIVNKKITGDFVPVFKRDLIKKHNFRYDDIKGGFPFLFTLSIFRLYDVITHDKVLYIYHEESKDRSTGGGQFVRRAHGMAITYGKFLEKFKADYELHNTKKLAYFYLEKSIFELINKQKKIGRSSLFIAVKYNWKKCIIAFLIFMCSLLPYNIFIYLCTLFHRFKKILQ